MQIKSFPTSPTLSAKPTALMLNINFMVDQRGNALSNVAMVFICGYRLPKHAFAVLVTF